MSLAKEVSGSSAQLDYSLDIQSLSKSFRRRTIGKSSYTTIKTSMLSVLFGKGRAQGSFTHAIKNLTMRIPRGSSVGVIGRNGSGKSTLLKLITGIYKPDQGSVSVNGKIAALIELGAGFHPDFTGRENLYLGAAMHGLTKAEIDDRFDEIVRFAELENVIDDPVKTYSSGMFMRLGFSLAIHTDPDVLIVDEVLAVGDAAFVAKCKDKIADLRREEKTLILVTHDLDAVERWCDEVLWLHAGEVRDRGDPRRVIDHYRQFIERGQEEELTVRQAEEAYAGANESTQSGDSGPSGESADFSEKRRWGSREVEITSVRICGDDGKAHLLLHSDDTARIEVGYKIRERAEDIVFGISINRSDGLNVHGTNTDIEKVKLLLRSEGTVTYHIDRLGLLEGTYYMDVAVHRSDGYPYDYHKNALTFAVRSAHNQVGVYVPAHRWEAA